MRTPLRLALLAGLVAAQLAVLHTMIAGNERVLREGQRFLFRTQPFDPHDPFQGRYVQLGFEDDFIPEARCGAVRPSGNTPLYVTLATNAQGFACLDGYRLTPPAEGPYLKTRSLGDHWDWQRGQGASKRDGLSIEMPFDRFYMDEAKAPLAEQAVRDATRGTNCWAAVRILNGRAVIEDVFVRGQSVRALKRR